MPKHSLTNLTSLVSPHSSFSFIPQFETKQNVKFKGVVYMGVSENSGSNTFYLIWHLKQRKYISMPVCESHFKLNTFIYIYKILILVFLSAFSIYQNWAFLKTNTVIVTIKINLKATLTYANWKCIIIGQQQHKQEKSQQRV